MDTWEAVFKELMKRGLKSDDVRIGILDGLPGLESLFQKTFPKSVTARCWVLSLRNALAKTPARLREPFKLLAKKMMYTPSEDQARQAFKVLKEAMGADAERAAHCLGKDLDSLVVHYRFEKRFWVALKTTNPIERINKEFKKRSRSMGTLGERALECLLAFTALRLEMGWKQVAIDSAGLANALELRHKGNALEETFAVLVH